MFGENEDFTSIDFDADWQCCIQTHENIDDDEWFSIELPHLTAAKDEADADRRTWRYRKQFDWISSEQQVYLAFQSANYDVDDVSLDADARVWLNEALVFSGSFLSLQQPIELTASLQSNEERRNKKHTNMLVVSCTNQSLAFHARVLVRGRVTRTAGRLQHGDKRMGMNVLQYTLSFDQGDGRIGVELDHEEKVPAIHPPPLVSLPSLGSFELITDDSEQIPVPRLAVVILIVGTRGDVQPFIALGRALRAAGHRVRLATHEIFRSFVRSHGLEFYPLAGDPDDLMSFMVKNAGLIPSMSTIIAGELNKQRHSLMDILASTWQACTADDDETSLPFTAEAIIANPPSFGHVHCAEKLQIPLHIMFTMPWSPTTAFPHPLCNITSLREPMDRINLYSYDLMETLTSGGMRTVINKFRKTILGLPTLSVRQAIGMLIDRRVPHTYCWSASVVPKPDDWGAHIKVTGFLFLDLATSYTNPPKELIDFLDLSEHQASPPIYIGFGSIVGHDSTHLLDIIIDALHQTGYRALLAGFSTDTRELPGNICRIGDVPHDWLFPHVSAVCHHGGAGTTATGLRAGKPTIIIPFFGDQCFWGCAVAKSGAGPSPLPIKTLTADRLADAFRFVHQPPARAAAEHIRAILLKEDGCAAAVQAFHDSLPTSRMCSDLEPTFAACYRLKQYKLQISRPVARVLLSGGVIDESELSPHPTGDWQFMYVRDVHMPVEGTLEPRPRTLSKLCMEQAISMRRAADTPGLGMGAVAVAGSLGKAFGLGLGHLSAACLSLYGEMTGFLEHAPGRYDPYSEVDADQKPLVEDFKSGAEAARRSLWRGWKEGIVGVAKEPYIGYQHDGVRGGVTGAALGAVNAVVKPVAGTLSSITWLGRGTYASMHTAMAEKREEKISVASNTRGLVLNSLPADDQQPLEDYELNQRISYSAQVASDASGYDPHRCEQILREFTKIKRDQDRAAIFASLEQHSP